MNDILIRNGRVIDPASGLDECADVAIAKGRISRVGKAQAKAKHVIDAHGLVVCPGLIDLHVHCREPGSEEKETIATAAATAVAGGFTTGSVRSGCPGNEVLHSNAPVPTPATRTRASADSPTFTALDMLGSSHRVDRGAAPCSGS